MMIIFLAIGILGSIYFINHYKGNPGLSLDGITESMKGEKPAESLEILDRRLASGEISRKEYDEIKNIIKDELEY